MKYRKIFVFMLMIVVMTAVYGQERYRAKPASTQLSIYSLPPLERAISSIKFYEGWHGEKKHWPYVGWGHKVLPRERFTNDITKVQGDSILRADMMKLCRLFSKFGRDSVILACLAYQVGAFRLLGNKNLPKSKLIRKLENGDRNIYEEYVSYCYRKGKSVASIKRRRLIELHLLYTP